MGPKFIICCGQAREYEGGVNGKIIGGILWAWAICCGEYARGAGLTFAANYDGTNFIDCATYDVGAAFGSTFSEACMFRAAGTGDIKLSRLTLPIGESTLDVPPDPANFRISIVEGDTAFISGRVIWSGSLEDTGTRVENHTIPLHGMIRGGQTYWLLYEQVDFDFGGYNWPFASSPLFWCRQDVPRDAGDRAMRYGADGYPPDSKWIFAGYDIRPAFRIHGNHLPQAQMSLSPVFKFGSETNLAVLITQGGGALLRLEGTGSDEDLEPLNFTWLDGTNVIAATATATNEFIAGTHWISFAVDDGEDVAIKSVRLDVFTLVGATERLAEMVLQSGASARDKQTFTKVLLNAGKAFDKGRNREGVSQLYIFERLVEARRRLLSWEMAAQWISAAEEIIKRSRM